MNFDDYENLPTTSVATNMTAGAIAGVLEHCVMYPLDSVKTRMQSLSPLTNGQTITSTMMNMINKEGILRPLRGVGAVVLGAGPAHALYFSSYEYSKEMMAKLTNNNTVNYTSSAVVATLIHDAISNPTEVIKQRLQMYNSQYRSVVHCMSTVYQQEGIRAFYRSYLTQLVMNLPYQAIHFSTYEFFQNIFNKEHKYNPPVHMVAGAAAGAAASAITTPLDVIKTLLNTQETGIGKTRGMLEAIAKINETAGVRGFFKGLLPRVLYAMPATAICWSTYEFFKYIIESRDKEISLSLRIKKSDSPKLSTTSEPDDVFVMPSAIEPPSQPPPSPPPSSGGGSIKPRELPAMSGAGMIGALQLNTIHSDTTTTRLMDQRCN